MLGGNDAPPAPSIRKGGHNVRGQRRGRDTDGEGDAEECETDFLQSVRRTVGRNATLTVLRVLCHHSSDVRFTSTPILETQDSGPSCTNSNQVASLQRLTERRCQSLVHKIVALDAEVRNELGIVYVDEIWNERHFLQALPDKWIYSRVVSEGDSLLGFWIASNSRCAEAGVYTHRLAVSRAARERRLASRMLADLRACATKRGQCALSLSVGTRNETAIAFYEHAGFRRLKGDELRSFIAAREIAGVKVHDGSFTQVETGFEKLVYRLPL